MKRILYASGEFLTDDAIADALMEYASVLAIVGSSDVIELPGVDGSGSICEVRMLVGPASQIVSMSTDEPTVPMDADLATAELRERARRRLPNSFDVGDSGGAPAESDAESTEH